MISFESHKADAERWLSYQNPNTPRALIRALEIIVELCERGQKLEAENALLKKQCGYLANDVIAAAQDYGAPMSDCRICDYAWFCERKPSQIEPNWDMCEAAVLKSCEPENCE